MDSYKIAVSKYKLTKKIPTGDPLWNPFNSSFKNCEINEEQLINVVFHGHPITTWHNNKWRSRENYICGQHLGLDFDTEDKYSSLDYLYSDPFISNYASFVHTTISHAEEKPRARVIFLLSDPIMQAGNYALAASSLLWLFGTADKQCKDSSRFWYGAPRCDMKIVGKVLPLDVVKKFIDTYQKCGMNEKKQSVRKDYAAPASQEKVADALKVIPAWGVSYDEWVSVLMGIHSEFGDAGLGLASSWADGKPGEVELKWKSFHDNGNTTGAISIGTVFALAKNHGWKP